jgi:hypothetical protein
MSQELAFADATRPTPVRCLCLNLRPYSLGHELLLLRYRNPLRCLSEAEFAALGFNAQIAAVTTAALICSQSHAAINRRQKWMRLWHWLLNGIDYVAETAIFRAYLAAGNACPRFAPSDPEFPGREAGAPELLNLHQWLSKHRATLIQQATDIWDYPLALARWECYAALEAEGRVRLRNRTDGDNNFAEWVEAQEAKVAAGEIHLPAAGPAN